MNIKYLGHSSFQIIYNNVSILVDPFIKDNPLAKGVIDLDKLEADYILLTHGHNDHVADAEYLAKKNQATIIANYEIVSWFEQKGIKGHPMNHGGSFQFDFGMIKMVNAVHSSVLPDGSNGGNPGGFVLSSKGEKTLYIAGDTALTYDMKLLPLKGNQPDVSILPIGSNFTMDVDDAIIASDFIACDEVIGCHYNTFGYIKIDSEKAIEKFKAKGKKLHLLEIGDSINY